MTLPEILDLVHHRSIVITLRGEKLHFDVRKEILTQELKSSVLQHKNKLRLIAKADIPDFQVIWRDSALPDGRKDKEPIVECSHCGGRSFWALLGSDVLPSCSTCRPLIGNADRRIFWIE